MPTPAAPHALILAPRGRDAAVAKAILGEAGIPALIVHDLAELGERLSDEVGLVVLTEEETRAGNLRPVARWIGAQPSWSDLSFLVLTNRGGGPERNPSASRLSDVLGNVTFVERPFHPTTFVSMARTSLRGRMRQYEARRRLEELRESEARLRTALTAGRLGSWELDFRTLALYASETCRACFGRCPDQSFGYDRMLDAAHPEDSPRMRASLEESRRNGTDYALEHRVIWPDGSVHWVEFRARVVRDEAGEPARLVGVSLDVTERKKVEQDLRSLAETLEERVLERTAELEQAHAAVLEEVRQREMAERQLRQAQKMEMLGQLTGGVAHDFNNLLMAVIGNLDLLRRTAEKGSREERLIDGAMQGAQRGASLTQRLLAFARQQELEVKPVDMGALVRGVSTLLARSVGDAAELRLEVALDMPPALADANQVELALLNLVVNARDAMKKGGAITVEADVAEAPPGCASLAPGRYIRLSVTDEGAGMDEETLRRAVEPFFSTKEVGKGTGLGLSMIHGLAVQLKGELRLESEPGRGTRAELWLPVAHDASVADEASAAPAEQARDESFTILLVDDDVLIAMSTSGLLEDLGHQVIEANSGEDALRTLRERPDIDIVITDFSMAGMTGAELARKARALRPGLPILLATGYADLPEGEEIELPRLRKPYMQDQLAAEISRLVGAA